MDSSADRHSRASHRRSRRCDVRPGEGSRRSKAIAQAGLTPHDIDFIVVGTTTPDMMFPSTACLLQNKIGADQRVGVRSRRGLLRVHLCADDGCAHGGGRDAPARACRSARMSCRASSITPIARRACCSAMAPARSSSARRQTGCGIIDFEHEIDGGGGPALCMPAGGSLRPASHETVDQRLHYVKQDGGTVFKFAVRKTEEICARIMERNNVTAARHRSVRVPSGQSAHHHVSRRAPRAGARKSHHQYRAYGNTTAGTIPLALTDAVADGRLKKGDLVLIASVGAGFTVGSVLLRWSI